jgi:hypothetical protein
MPQAQKVGGSLGSLADSGDSRWSPAVWTLNGRYEILKTLNAEPQKFDSGCGVKRESGVEAWTLNGHYAGPRSLILGPV